MTPAQAEMNAAIAALTGEEVRNYSTCLNAARKARRACGLGLPRDAEKRNRYLAAVCSVVQADDPSFDAYDMANPSAWQQCRALIKAFGGGK